jgi:4-alpha-glucanotransferase
LQEACVNFRARNRGDNYDRFCEENGYWLTDFAHFTALKEHYGNISWSDWPAAIRDRQPDALEVSKREFAERIEREKVFQFLFYRQWMSLKNYCRQNHIRIIGDLPIYLSNQSADVWAHPEIFKLDENKKPTHISGVPPDYFSKTGQLWGNPVYNWDKLAESDFQWWLKRIEHNLKLFDVLRIDHFRGLVAYWEVAAGEKTAINGRWVNVPVTSFFERLRQHCPYLPLIAEDLGIITPDVQEVIKQLDIPGMKVLLFAFGDNSADNPYAPHNHVRKCVVYTGTHDNNTIKGWFEKEAPADEKRNLARYLGKEVSAGEISWDFIRMAMMSVADTIIVPMQHILGLGDEARMNIPSTVEGNWEWRLNADHLTSSLRDKLRDFTEIFGRIRR